MTRWAAFLAGLGFAACSQPQPVQQPRPELTSEQIVSGTTFLTADTQALQADDFSNPGFLWVDRGSELFVTAPSPDQPVCNSCHEAGLAGAAASYPAIDAQSGELLNLEGRINMCRTRHQKEPALAYESEDLLALSAYVAEQSRGMARRVRTDGLAAPHYQAGRDYFYTRRGQFNLSCSQCHTENWGQKLRGDTISQGHGNGFPAYRLEWQSLGSLHRRFNDCDLGVRAQPMPLGSDIYTDLELYLAERSSGLALESPAVRR